MGFEALGKHLTLTHVELFAAMLPNSGWGRQLSQSRTLRVLEVIHSDTENAEHPIVRELAALSSIASLSTLHLRSFNQVLNDECAFALASMSQLTDLEMTRECKFTSKGAQALASLSSLILLNLAFSPTEDKAKRTQFERSGRHEKYTEPALNIGEEGSLALTSIPALTALTLDYAELSFSAHDASHHHASLSSSLPHEFSRRERSVYSFIFVLDHGFARKYE